MDNRTHCIELAKQVAENNYKLYEYISKLSAEDIKYYLLKVDKIVTESEQVINKLLTAK